VKEWRGVEMEVISEEKRRGGVEKDGGTLWDLSINYRHPEATGVTYVRQQAAVTLNHCLWQRLLSQGGHDCWIEACLLDR
jgi:hypothetical protein